MHLKAQECDQLEEKLRRLLYLLRNESKAVEILKKPKTRKKKLLFEANLKPDPKQTNTKTKHNIPKIKVAEKSSSQLYSQSNTNGKSFVKQCNLAIYWGPIDKYNKKSKDFSQTIEDHEKEFELLEQEIKNNNPPKYIFESRNIIRKFSEVSEKLFDVYSKNCSGILDNEKLQSFIQSELNRISLVYFSSLDGVKVNVSTCDEGLKNNIKKNNLLYEKYQENYISDLIDPVKSAVRVFLYNYSNDEHIDMFDNNVEEDKSYMFEELTQNR